MQLIVSNAHQRKAPFVMHNFMTVRITIMFLFSLTFTKAKSQTYSSIVTDQEIHNFFYELNKSKAISQIHKLSPDIFAWAPMLLLEDTSDQELPFYFLSNDGKEYVILKASIGKEDIEFIKQQIQSIKGTIWDFNHLKGFIPADSIINKEIMRKSISGKKRIKDNYSYTFSLPLYSLDKKSVIIYQDFFCGALCSTSCIYLYKNDGSGKWQQVLSWNCWST